MTYAALNQAFEKIEIERKHLYERLKSYDEIVLHAKPKPDAWSVIEVIEHLIAAEQASLQYLRKKTKDLNGAKKSTIGERFRSMALHFFLAAPIKFKAPSVAEPLSNNATLADTQARWNAIRTDLNVLWNNLPEDVLDRSWFKHALAGKLNLMQMLEFFGNHFERHEHQIWRTLKSVGGTQQ